MAQVLALADDLTGALEAGAKFYATVVAWPRFSSTPGYVVDTESRHLPPQEAAGRIRKIAGGSAGAMIYKKTDSTLRGNIGAELGELLAAHPESPLIYAPAYPRMGRVVKRGHLYVHGAPAHQTSFAGDALNPVSDSDIACVLRSQTRFPVCSITVRDMADLAPGSIYVCDGESEADIAQAARAVSDKRYTLAAGPAAFAEALAEQLDLPRPAGAPWPSIRSCLVINGSRHELSVRQVRHAVARGWPRVPASAVPESEWVVLDGTAEGTELQVAARVGELARDILARVELQALAVFGGDTAYGVLTAIGNPALQPLGEIVPGVPLSRVIGRDLYLITKAGGFGSEDVLTAIRNALL